MPPTAAAPPSSRICLSPPPPHLSPRRMSPFSPVPSRPSHFSSLVMRGEGNTSLSQPYFSMPTIKVPDAHLRHTGTLPLLLSVSKFLDTLVDSAPHTVILPSALPSRLDSASLCMPGLPPGLLDYVTGDTSQGLKHWSPLETTRIFINE